MLNQQTHWTQHCRDNHHQHITNRNKTCDELNKHESTTIPCAPHTEQWIQSTFGHIITLNRQSANVRSCDVTLTGIATIYIVCDSIKTGNTFHIHSTTLALVPNALFATNFTIWNCQWYANIHVYIYSEFVLLLFFNFFSVVAEYDPPPPPSTTPFRHAFLYHSMFVSRKCIARSNYFAIFCVVPRCGKGLANRPVATKYIISPC